MAMSTKPMPRRPRRGRMSAQTSGSESSKRAVFDFLGPTATSRSLRARGNLLGVTRNDVRTGSQGIDLASLALTFEGLAAYFRSDLQIGSGDAVEQLRGMQVTAGFFSLLGHPPALGREFQRDIR